MLKQINGNKIGSNVILVPVEHSRKMQKLFNEFRITPEIREIWIRE
jgi:hypothetical protein